MNGITLRKRLAQFAPELEPLIWVNEAPADLDRFIVIVEGEGEVISTKDSVVGSQDVQMIRSWAKTATDAQALQDAILPVVLNQLFNERVELTGINHTAFSPEYALYLAELQVRSFTYF